MTMTALALMISNWLKPAVEIGMTIVALGILVAIVSMSLMNSARWVIDSYRKLRSSVIKAIDGDDE